MAWGFRLELGSFGPLRALFEPLGAAAQRAKADVAFGIVTINPDSKKSADAIG